MQLLLYNKITIIFLYRIKFVIPICRLIKGFSYNSITNIYIELNVHYADACFKKIDNETSKVAYHSEKVFNAQKLGRILTNFS